jgi:hypothetical protein
MSAYASKASPKGPIDSQESVGAFWHLPARVTKVAASERVYGLLQDSGCCGLAAGGECRLHTPPRHGFRVRGLHALKRPAGAWSVARSVVCSWGVIIVRGEGATVLPLNPWFASICLGALDINCLVPLPYCGAKGDRLTSFSIGRRRQRQQQRQRHSVMG